MNNETKRDVFKNVVETLNVMYGAPIYDYCKELIDHYDSALPDDLPVIPKEVGEYIRKAKAPGKWGLLDVFWHLGDNISAVGINGLYDWQRWIIDNQNTFGRAWLLGVWRIEEAGEATKHEKQ